jgi:hypothetical protein
MVPVIMKAGIIDIFLDSFGWVLGKTTVFAFAVMLGVAIGSCALFAGTRVGGGELEFSPGALPIYQYLGVVTAILPQLLVVFWAGMVFVRSESASAGHWVSIVAAEALVLTGCFSRALPGTLAQVVAWIVTLSLIGGVAAIISKLEHWKVKRGVDHLERLQEENLVRRAGLKEKYGTENAGAGELGIL